METRLGSLKGAPCGILLRLVWDLIVLVAPFFFPPLLPIMFPCGLSKPHQATMLPSQGNLGQALSLLIKKGIFFFVIHWGGGV